MSNSSGSSGFSLIAVVFIVVILAVAVIGGLVYKDYRDITPAKAKTAPAVSDAPAISQLINTFYQKYTSVDQSDPTTGTLSGTIQKYGTVRLIIATATSYSVDPMLCSQLQPDNFSVGSVTTDATGGSAPLTEQFGTTTEKLTVKVVKDSGSLKIDSVTCPPIAGSSD